MTEHTPGPWEVNGNHRLDICAGNAGVVATVLAPTTVNGKANARLIAAAPDLLAALEVFVGLCPMCYSGQECLDDNCHMARAAIAKARARGQYNG